MSEPFTLSLWTADLAIARAADAAGVDRIGVDLDRLGKAERQRGLATWISPHTARDLERLRPAVTRGQLFARTNPLHVGTAEEVEALLAAGAQVLMLPMFRTAEDVASFSEIVARRARVVGLIETREAARQVEEVVAVDGLDELHVGINDLALSLGMTTRFAVLVSPHAERIARAAGAAGVPLGVGGIGRACDTTLPIRADLVYAQLVRLGASAALLARSFVEADGTGMAAEVARARDRLAWWAGRPTAERDDAARELRAALGEGGGF